MALNLVVLNRNVLALNLVVLNWNVLALNLVVNAPYRLEPMRRCNSEETYVVYVVPDGQDSCSDLTQDEEKHQHRVLQMKKKLNKKAFQ